MNRLLMARMDWDRLRRIEPLDGADPRVDPDGAILWEREVGPAREGGARTSRTTAEPSAGIRRLRDGIVVRRVRERREADAAATAIASPAPSHARSAVALDTSAWIECPRCHAWVPRKKLLLHARASCTRKGAP